MGKLPSYKRKSYCISSQLYGFFTSELVRILIPISWRETKIRPSETGASLSDQSPPTFRYFEDAVDVVLLIRRFVEGGALRAADFLDGGAAVRHRQRETRIRLEVLNVVDVSGQLLVGQLLEHLRGTPEGQEELESLAAWATLRIVRSGRRVPPPAAAGGRSGRWL